MVVRTFCVNLSSYQTCLFVKKFYNFQELFLKEKMHIWILAKREKFDIYENTRFQEVAKSLGIVFRMVAPEDCEIIATRGGRKSIHIERLEVDQLPDCLITRTGSGTTYFASAVIRHLERLDTFVLNTSVAIAHAMDKMETIQMLAAENIPVPKTILAKHPLDIEFIENEFSYPLILKKVSGSEGKGIVLCRDSEQLQDTAELLDENLNVILQECISNSLGRDVRVFVVGGRAIGAMERTAKKGSFKANYSAGGTVKTIKLTPEMEWLAVESARIIGLDIAGVDLLFDNDGFQVCEVNSAPYFEGFEEATGIDIPKAIYDFASVRLEGTMQSVNTE